MDVDGHLHEGDSVGNVMLAGTVGQVVESSGRAFAKGDLVQGLLGWEDYTISDGKGLMGLQKLPAGTDPLLALSLLGTTGTDRLLRHAIGRKREGGRDVRSVGRGGRDGIGGGDDREGQRMPRHRHRGRARQVRLADRRRRASTPPSTIRMRRSARRSRKHCPNGIDVYFDNVGGEILDHALARLRDGARIVLCGAISRYNEARDDPVRARRTT